jgi:hypothetical protein
MILHGYTLLSSLFLRDYDPTYNTTVPSCVAAELLWSSLNLTLHHVRGAAFVTMQPKASQIVCPSLQDHRRSVSSQRSDPSWAHPGHCRSSHRTADTFQEAGSLSHSNCWCLFGYEAMKVTSAAVFTCLYNAGSPWDFLSSTTYKEGLSSNTWDHK